LQSDCDREKLQARRRAPRPCPSSGQGRAMVRQGRHSSLGIAALSQPDYDREKLRARAAPRASVSRVGLSSRPRRSPGRGPHGLRRLTTRVCRCRVAAGALMRSASTGTPVVSALSALRRAGAPGEAQRRRGGAEDWRRQRGGGQREEGPRDRRAQRHQGAPPCMRARAQCPVASGLFMLYAGRE